MEYFNELSYKTLRAGECSINAIRGTDICRDPEQNFACVGGTLTREAQQSQWEAHHGVP
jgi:hypothetical protein